MGITDYLIVLIIPSVMLICGMASRQYPPDKINSLYGYRTPRSMQNDESWKLAQKLMSKFFVYYAAASFAFGVVISVICRIFLNKDFIPSVIMLIQSAGIFSIFFVVESKLKDK